MENKSGIIMCGLFIKVVFCVSLLKVYADSFVGTIFNVGQQVKQKEMQLDSLNRSNLALNISNMVTEYLIR